MDPILKTAKPISVAFNGTKAFKIETIPLSTSVSANANKKAGKNVDGKDYDHDEKKFISAKRNRAKKKKKK